MKIAKKYHEAVKYYLEYPAEVEDAWGNLAGEHSSLFRFCSKDGESHRIVGGKMIGCVTQVANNPDEYAAACLPLTELIHKNASRIPDLGNLDYETEAVTREQLEAMAEIQTAADEMLGR